MRETENSDVCETTEHAKKNNTEYYKACKLKEAERIALQRLDVFEAKQVYKNNAEYKKACKLKEAERIALHKTRCL